MIRMIILHDECNENRNTVKNPKVTVKIPHNENLPMKTDKLTSIRLDSGLARS